MPKISTTFFFTPKNSYLIWIYNMSATACNLPLQIMKIYVDNIIINISYAIYKLFLMEKKNDWSLQHLYFGLHL